MTIHTDEVSQNKKDANSSDVSSTTTSTTPSSTSWININNDYLFPKSFLENCVVFVQRSGSTLIIRTTEDYNDLTTVLPSEAAAIKTMQEINAVLNEQEIQCNIEFSPSPDV